MPWYQSPICVRYVRGDESHATSGVSLQFRESSRTLLHYVLTVSVLSEASLQGYTTYVTGDDLVDRSADSVQWYEAAVDFRAPVCDHPEVKKFISFFASSGFSVLPTDLVTCDVNDIAVVGLRCDLPLVHKEIRFVATDRPQPVEIVSFPFNFTNPILFSRFVSEGHLNYTLKDAGGVLGYLSDIKFVENMEGGLCNGKNGSLGLLMGHFRKFNGDGDLMFVLSWALIWKLLHKKFPNNSLIDAKLTLNKLSGTESETSVLPILLSSNYRQNWGSCVVFNNEYLITNNHVVKPYLANNKTHCYIYLHHEIIELGPDDAVSTPFAEIDLSFIKLSLPNQFKLQSCPYSRPADFTTAYETGDPVKTVGYGLFFNRDILQPLECHGRISAKSSITYGFQSIPSIIITSASCWNGSSGGALMKDDSVVGIICSNAEVKLPNINNNKQESEKLSNFCFVLPVEIIMKCFDVVHSNNTKFGVAQKFVDLWTLRSTHTDKLVVQPKL